MIPNDQLKDFLHNLLSFTIQSTSRVNPPTREERMRFIRELNSKLGNLPNSEESIDPQSTSHTIPLSKPTPINSQIHSMFKCTKGENHRISLMWKCHDCDTVIPVVEGGSGSYGQARTHDLNSPRFHMNRVPAWWENDDNTEYKGRVVCPPQYIAFFMELGVKMEEVKNISPEVFQATMTMTPTIYRKLHDLYVTDNKVLWSITREVKA